MLECPACHEGNPERARYCWSCGAALSSPPPAQEVRKTVTVVFSDVTGSTSLGERLDPESMRRVMSRYFDTMRTVLERHGGTVEKFIGDAVMAVFGIPQLHEDDALRAVRAAAEMRDALERLNEELERGWAIRIQNRTGVNTGEVVTGNPAASQALVTGDAVNVAARLEQAAKPGEILLGEDTRRLIRDAVTVESLVPLALKGKSAPVAAYRLLTVQSGAPAFARRLDSPLVGRTREQALLLQAFERTIGEQSCHLFTVLGPAGAGKSRLVEELIGQVDLRATVLRGRCLPYGESITFWPVRELVKQAADLQDGEATEESRAKIGALLPADSDGPIITERIAEAIGLTEGGAAQEEIFWAVRKFLEAMARRQPLVALFDDIHWADQTFLDLIEHIADWSRDAPILLLCPARPELLDQRSTWGGGKMNATSILLAPLTDGECVTLIENLLGQAGLVPEAEARITEAAEGNPLFVEEMLRMLIDDGLLYRQDGHWVPRGDLSRVPVPATIQALLAARLDRLQEEERRVIERASIGGKVFYRGAVAELLPEADRSAVGRHLMTLVRRELVRVDTSTFAGEDAFRFRHILIRDTAYESMPKKLRAELHERFATWLERAAGERDAEYEEILGYHLEQAFRYHQELGLVDERAETISRQAAARLGRAGRRALDRGDRPAARNLLLRATALLPTDDVERLELLLDLGDNLREIGELTEAATMFDEVLATTARLQNLRLQTHARILSATLQITTDPTISADELSRDAERLIPLLEQWEDDLGLARAWQLLALCSLVHATWADVAARIDRAMAHARRAGSRRDEGSSSTYFCGALYFGPTPAEEGMKRLEELIVEYADSRFVEGDARAVLGVFAAMRCQSREARELIRRAVAIAEDMGSGGNVAFMRGFCWGAIEMLAGDLEAAERELRRSYTLYEAMGDKGFRCSIAALLADVLYLRERYDEAEEFNRIVEELATDDDAEAQFHWRSTRAMLLGRRGDMVEAERLAREAVAIATRTDMLSGRGDTLMSLAEVLHLNGQAEKAAPVIEEAIRLYDAKGNLVSAERARAKLVTLTG